jgi:L-glyceraldehyde 3-phosphate reductase
MLNRWVEGGLLDLLGTEGIGCIVFSPLAQGMLSDRYLEGVPEGSRAARGGSLTRSMLSPDTLGKIRGLHEIAARRGQSLSQMAIAWVLRDPRVTSALIGVSSVEQLEEDLGALRRLEFAPGELAEIDRLATESGVNIWAPSSAH